MMKKSFSRAFAYGLLVALIVAFSGSCEVGLGEAVDTTPPTVSATRPSANAIVRGDFLMSGICDDDSGLESVAISLKNTSTNAVYPSQGVSWAAEVGDGGATWTCAISLKSTPIPDGKYEATITATDRSGRVTSSTQSFVIDNTPPLVILTRPSAKAGDSSADAYGQTLSIEGSAYDDNNIDSIELTVYDKDKPDTPLRTITITNVPKSVDLDAAKWGETENSEIAGAYEEIYGYNYNAGTKKYYLTATVYDEARTVTADAAADSRDKGNSASYYFLSDDIYSKIKTYNTTDVYKMLTGTYTGNAGADAVANVVKILSGDSDYAITRGYFSLNPANNPSFSINGYGAVSGSGTEKATALESSNPITSGSTITVTMSAGLDQSPLVEDTLGICLYPIKNGSIDENSPVWLIKPADDAATDGEKNARKLLKKSGSIYTASVIVSSSGSSGLSAADDDGKIYTYTTDALALKTAYILCCVGSDEDGFEFAYDGTQGFYLAPNGAAPVLTVTSPDSAASYLTKDDSISFYGTVTAESKTTVTFTSDSGKPLTFTDASGNTISSWTTSSDTPSGETWGSFTIPASVFTSNNADKSADCYITVTATAGGLSTAKQYTVYYDAAGPEIDINSVSPLVTFDDGSGTNTRSDTVNGHLNFSVRVSDADSKVDTTDRKPALTILDESGNAINVTGVSPLTFNTANITGTIDLEKLYDEYDNQELTLRFSAADAAGNTSSGNSATRNSSEEDYTVYLNKESDIPVIELTNAVTSATENGKAIDYTGTAYPDGGSKNVFLAGATITMRVTDDDGLASVTVTRYGAAANGSAESESATEMFYPSGATSYLLSYTVPETTGSYYISVQAVDNDLGVTSAAPGFWIKVDTGAPTIAISSTGMNYGHAGGTVSASGTVTGVSNLKVWSAYAGADSTANKAIPDASQPAETATQAAWSDDLKIPENTDEGKQTNTYTVTDLYNRTGTAVFTYYVDNTPPTVTIAEGTYTGVNAVSSSDFKFSGTAADSGSTVNSGVSSVYYQIVERTDSAAAAPSAGGDGWTQLNSAGNWNFYQSFTEGTASADGTAADGALFEGSWTLYVYAEDSAGNCSSVASLDFDVDLNRPEIDVSVVPDGAETVPVTDGKTVSVAKAYTLSVKPSDTHGLALSDALTVTVARDGKELDADEFTLSGSDDDTGAYTVTLHEDAADGAADGLYTYTLTAKDITGKTTAVTVYVRLDTQGPKVEISSPTFTDNKSEWQTKKAVKIVGSAEDDTGVSAVYVLYGTAADTEPTAGGNWDGWEKADGATSWSVTLKDGNVKEGANTIYVAAEDTNYNVSAVTAYTLNVDLNAPEIKETTYQKGDGTAATLSDNGSFVVSGAFTLRGTVSDTYQLASLVLSGTSDGGGTSGTNKYPSESESEFDDLTITENADGTSWTWKKTFNPSSSEESGATELADGKWTFTLTVTDAAGKTAENTYTVTVDNEAPAFSTRVQLDWSDGASGDSTWHKKSSATLSASVSDSTSGVSAVYYYVTDEELFETASSDQKQISGVTFENTMNYSDGSAKKTVSFSDGAGYVYLKAVDAAGNASYYGTGTRLAYHVDTTAPSVTVKSPAAGALISAGGDLTVTLEITDETSGFSSGTVTLTDSGTGKATATANVTASAVTDESGDTVADTYTVTLSGEAIGKFTGDTAALTVTAKDTAGNISAEKTVTLAFDRAAPTVTFANPAAKTVNGKVSVNGTASDDNSLASVTLYRTALSGETATDSITADNGATVSVVSLGEFPNASAYNWRLADDIDTSESPFSDGASVTLYAVAVDSAGNTKTETKTVTVDQDGDRPVIKITNMTLADMSADNSVWHKQGTLYGTVTDDDGVTALYIYAGDSAPTDSDAWGSDLYSSGAWEYTLDDGATTLWFKVIDAADGIFISAADADKMLKSPKLTDGTNNFGYKTADNSYGSDAYTDKAYTAVYLTVDTTAPSISTSSYYRKDDSYSSDLTDTAGWYVSSGITSESFGGPDSKLYFMVTASDENGIDSISAVLGDITGKSVTNATASTATGLSLTRVFEFDTYRKSGGATVIDSGYKTLKITAVDNAGASSTTQFTVNIDNTAPSIRITSHKDGNTVYGSFSVSVKGVSDDAARLWFAVTKDAGTAPADSSGTAYTEITQYTSTSAWTVAFSDTAESDVYTSSTLNTWLNTLYDSGTSDKDDTQNVCFWIYGKDSLGNESDPVTLSLRVNPQGDKPSVEITYPDSGDTVGGTIRMTGTSTVPDAQASVEAVWIQIAVGTDDFEGWNDTLSSLIDGKNVGYEITELTNVTLGGSKYGIKAKGSPASWNLPINSLGELVADTGGNVSIAVRAYAVSSSDKVSEAAEVQFTIDPNSPVIGDSVPLCLVQYDADGKIVKQRAYEADMWISGEWYLRGSIEDDSGISRVTLNDTSLTASDSLVKYTSTKYPNAQNYLLNYPVGSVTGFGSVSYTITAYEGSDENKYVTAKVSLNYDNTPPVMSAELSAEGNTVVQSDGTYTMDGKLEETGASGANQSGFGRIAFYFTRKLKDENNKETTYLIDPMLQKGSGKENRYDITNVTTGTVPSSDDNFTQTADGLYWRKYGVNSDSISGSAFTLSSSPHDNVRAGGICRIQEVDYLIKEVSGSTITVDGTPPESFDTAYFAVAQIIDNLTTETGTTGLGNSITNDDGDYMVEGVRKSGTTYSWTVSINSANISDGPVAVHFVGFDAAGNYTKTCASSDETPVNVATLTGFQGEVANNAPRLAGYRFGTDENGDGVVDDNELSDLYSALAADGKSIDSNTKLYSGEAMPTRGTDETPLFTAKGVTVFVPEIVGGNGKLGYTYTATHKDDNALTRTISVRELKEKISEDDEETTDKEVMIGLGDFVNADNDGGVIQDGVNTLAVKIWDDTEGHTYGTNSQWAQFAVIMNVNVRDAVKPAGHISPFYWNSASDNSLYGNSAANGHIELEKDLPTDTFTESKSGEYDRDPKVSGVITLSGTASDDVLLSGIYLHIDGFEFPVADDQTSATEKQGDITYYRIASYSGGVWTGYGSLDTVGWTGRVEEDGAPGQSGHTVTWYLDFDTQKIDGCAAKDTAVRLLVTDRGSLSGYDNNAGSYTENVFFGTGTTNTGTDGSETLYYRMDVVPYITGIERPSGAANAEKYQRSKLGRYAVQEGETITVTGFNFGISGATVNVGGNSVSGPSFTEQTRGSTDAAYYSFTMAVPSASGELSVTRNGVTSLNHQNGQDGGASYNFETNDYFTGGTMYDNRYLSVWALGNYFANTNGGVELQEPVMTADTAGNLYASWVAQSNSNVMFSRGVSNTNTTAVFRCYDQPATATAVSFDTKGDSGGLNIGFIPEHQGKSGSFSTTGFSSALIIGGAGAINIPTSFATGTDVLSSQTVQVDGNPHLKMDGSNYTAYYNLANYDMNRRLGSFEAPHAARYGNYLHNIWYDNVTQGLKYSVVDVNNTQDSRIGNSKFMLENAGGAVAGWVVLDGGYTGQDRVHEITASTTSGNGDTNNTLYIGGDSHAYTNSSGTVYSTELFLSNGTSAGVSTYLKDKDLKGITTDSGHNGAYFLTYYGGSGSGSIASGKESIASSFTPSAGMTVALMNNTAGNYSISLRTITEVHDWNNGTVSIYYNDEVTHDIQSACIYGGDMNVVGGTATTNYSGFNPSDESTDAGSSAAIDVTSTGLPVVAYLDAAGSTLRVAYATDTQPDLASEWKRQTVTDVICAGEISMKIDSGNNIHIMYKNGDSALCYIYGTPSDSGSGYTFSAEEVIDTTGSLEYGALSVIETDSAKIPAVTYINSAGTAQAVKYAYRTAAPSDTPASGEWDYQIVPSQGSGHYALKSNQLSLEARKTGWESTDANVLTNGGKSVTPKTVTAAVAYKTSTAFETAYLKEE